MSARRILVTEAQDRGPLAAIRCLSDAGFEVSAVGESRVSPGLWSRACSRADVLPSVEDIDAYVSGLERVLRAVRHDALIAGTDASLYLVSRHRRRLAPLVRLGLPSHEVVLAALDRSRLAQFAAAGEIVTPPTQVCTGPAEAVAAAESFGYPVLVKPVMVVTESDGRLVRHHANLASDAAAVRRLQKRLGACIVQARVPGMVVSIAGVSTGDGLLASVLARHYRTWPPRAGSASFVETMASDPELIARVDAFVRAIGWRGVWQLQFIEGPGGVLHAIDFNPRPYGCLGMADAAGVPLVSLWCHALLGMPLAPPKATPGVRWRMGDLDVRHAWWQMRHGHYRAAAVAVQPHRRTAHAFFRVRDPLPFFSRAAELVVVRARRGFA